MSRKRKRTVSTGTVEGIAADLSQARTQVKRRQAELDEFITI